MDNDGILSKRMPDAGMPGIMRKENDKYKIYESKKFMAKYKECSKDPNKSLIRKIILMEKKFYLYRIHNIVKEVLL